MNDNQGNSTFICKKCGNLNQGTTICQFCGNDVNSNLNSNSVSQTNNNYISNNSIDVNATSNVNNTVIKTNDDINNKNPNVVGNGKKKKDRKASCYVCLILSILNLIFVLPAAFQGWIAVILITAMIGNEMLYNIPYYGGFGYFFASLVGIIIFIVNFICNSKHLKLSFLILFLSFCIGCFIPVFLQKSDFSFEKAAIEKNDMIYDKIVFDNDDLIIRQDRVEYIKNDIRIYFKVQTSNIDNYSIDIYNMPVRVDKCVVHFLELIKYDESNGLYLYYIEIPYDQLYEYNIKEPKEIDLYIDNKIENKYYNIKFELNTKNDKDISKLIGLDKFELLYTNEYFNLYFDKQFDSGSGDLYFQSKTSENCKLELNEFDMDLPGYSRPLSMNLYLYDYSIYKHSFNFHPCKDNFSYLKFKYKIIDLDGKEIHSGEVDDTYSFPKIDTRYCLANK